MDSTYENQKIIDVEIDKEMKKSFLEYSMSVIIARALPDVRDGFKPVHRRILYAMYEDGLTYNKPYRKSATTVGNVLGRYHPHGDMAVYDAMVRMAQPFSLRYPLIDGQGNFGNVDGDGPAAYRYTEARMNRLCEEMMTDIEKNVVDNVLNFDNKLEEPVVLPSRFPNLLVNGSMGIAVAMATNIPPHNLGEVVDGVIAVIENPDLSVLELMKYIKGPDFPTYASIYGTSGIIEGYMTGRGKVTIRAKAEIEEYKKTHRIIVTEIPYQVNKAGLVASMADLVKDKRIDGITDIRDESGRAGMRIVIDLRRDVNPLVILNQLYKFSQLQDTFAMNMLALVDGEPKILNLKQMIEYYIKHQVDVVTRRVKFDLEKAKQRMHIYEGLKIALDNIDEVINIIRSKKTVSEAKQALIQRFDFSDAQGQAIVDLPLGRLSGFEIEKIIEELERLTKLVEELTGILADPNSINRIIKDDLLEIKRKYNDERRTEIIPNEDEIFTEDLIDREECVVTMTEAGYIKRQPANAYQAQRRGGKGISAMGTKEDDFVTDMFASNSHDMLLMFTNKGKVYEKKCYEIPASSRTSKGMNMVNLLELGEDESVSTIIPVSDKNDKGYLFMVTKNGVVKRTRLSEYSRINRNGKIAINLDDGDELAFVLRTSGGDEIFIAATNGLGLKIHENAVRVMGRTSRGVRGIRLAKGAFVTGVTVNSGNSDLDGEDEAEEFEDTTDIAETEESETDETEDTESAEGEETDEEEVTIDNNVLTVITITKNGFGKRCEFDRFTRRNRGGKGMTCHKINEKTGELVGALSVYESDDIMMITDDGTMIRTPVSGIPVYNNRSSAGVKVMKTAEGVSVKSFIRIAAEDKEDEEENDIEEKVIENEIGEIGETDVNFVEPEEFYEEIEGFEKIDTNQDSEDGE
ncbi:MAG: DNA gyrase subunit A [Oscillospiraceae bacterium]|nr:DNA gyrase subunit A [Oscillospiraceae bacterium]